MNNNLTLELTPKEARLIHLIREKYRFGRIVVVMHEGQPQRVEQTIFEIIG